jgi:prevent-host-death family protein
MTHVGAFHAKTHLAELLARVEKGEKVMITRRGKPVAMLIPPAPETVTDVAKNVKEMLELRRRSGPVLGNGLTIQQLRDEGRR